MASVANNVAKETIIVEGIGKYGPKANGRFYSLSQKSGLRLENFTIGGSYDVLVYTSEKGSKYINQIVSEGAKQYVPQPVAKPESSAVETASKDTYWKEKNDSQKLGGIMHDAAEVTAALIMANGLKTEEALATFEAVLGRIISIRGKLD